MPTTDERAIRQLIADWMAATKAGDIDGVLSLMADDVVFLRPGQPPMIGKSTFAELARGMAGEDAPVFDATSEIREVVVLGDWAYAWTRLAVVVTPPGGGPPSHRAGDTLSLFRKHGDRWLLARDANLLAPAEPGDG